jgi:hypothetical protein
VVLHQCIAPCASGGGRTQVSTDFIIEVSCSPMQGWSFPVVRDIFPIAASDDSSGAEHLVPGQPAGATSVAIALRAHSGTVPSLAGTSLDRARRTWFEVS